MPVDLTDFIRGMPKAELHVHIEGSLEPDLRLALAKRNGPSSPLPGPRTYVPPTVSMT